MTMEVNFSKAAPVAKSDKNEVTAKVGDALKTNVPVGAKNPDAPVSKDMEVRSKIETNETFTTEQKNKLSSMLDDALNQVRDVKKLDMDNLPAPKTVKGDFGFDEVLADFKGRLDTWVANQRAGAAFAEEARNEDNTQTIVAKMIDKNFTIPPEDKGLVTSLIAEEMDKLPQGDTAKAAYATAIYQKVSESLSLMYGN